MSHVRGVALLQLDRVNLTPERLRLLQTLNPTTLLIADDVYPSKALNTLEQLRKDPSNPDLRWKTEFLLPSGLPDYARLTPRLESLEFLPYLGYRSYLPDTWKATSLPSTLTSLGLGHVILKSPCSGLFPPGLRVLTLHRAEVSLDELFENLPCLEALSLGKADEIEFSKDFVFPDTLTSLDLGIASVLPTMLRPHSPLRQSSIRIFKMITNSGRTEPEPDLIFSQLPTTVTNMDVDLSSLYPEPRDYGPWPPLLRALRLTYCGSNLTTVLKLKELSHLETFYLNTPRNLSALDTSLSDSNVEHMDSENESSNWEDDGYSEHFDRPIFLAAILPSSLTKLYLRIRKFEPLSELSSITPMLSRLSSLEVDSFHLPDLDTFLQHAPNCRISWTRPIQLWSHGEGAFLINTFRHLLSPILDSDAFINAIITFCMINQLHFEIAADAIPFYGARRLPATISAIIRQPSTNGLLHNFANNFLQILKNSTVFPKLASIQVRQAEKPSSNWFFGVPNFLTRLDLEYCPLPAKFFDLPATLTWLSSMTTEKIIEDSDVDFSRSRRPWPFDRLKHLDTPNWTIQAHHLGYLRDLEVFNICIADLADYNVIDLLTTAVTPNARRNMNIGITYYPTGSIIPDDIEDFAEVDWASIGPKTDEILKRLLASPMPSLDAQSGSLDDNGSLIPESGVDSDTDLIGRVVKSIQIVERKYFPFCIPASATRFSINGDRKDHGGEGWHLFPNWRHATPHVNGLRSQIPNLSDLPDGDVVLAFNRPHSTTKLPVFPRKDLLTHLNLYGVLLASRWFHSLPTSLVHLDISCRGLLTNLTPPFPPVLETLILEDLWTPGRGGPRNRLNFSFSGLPSTLRSLVMKIPYWIGGADLHLSNSLPNLKVALFSHISWNESFLALEFLSLSPLDRFEAISMEGCDESSLEYNGRKLTLANSIDWNGIS